MIQFCQKEEGKQRELSKETRRMKEKILFTTLPTNDLGLLARSLPIAKGLGDRGYNIVFSHPAKSPIKMIRDAGFENIIPKHPLYEVAFSGFSFSRLKSLIKSGSMKNDYGGLFKFFGNLFSSLPLKREKFTDQVWDTDQAFAITGGLNYKFVKVQCETYTKVIEKSGADIIIDFWNPFACIAARKLGKKLITINQADALPHGKGFIWWKQKPSQIQSVVSTFNKLLKEYSLNTINKIEDLNVGDMTLVIGMPDTDPLDGDHNFKYIGPVVWQNPESEIPVWFKDLPTDKPVIWLYGGNPRYGGNSKIFDSIGMLKACMEALAEEDWHVVLAMGHHKFPEELKPVPKNFQCVDFAPGILLAERCDLMIHHGGYGSCQTALIAGTPSLIIPTFSERESNARRIVAIGAGALILPSIMKRKKYYDSVAIKMKAKEMLLQPMFKENAKKCGQKLKTYGGIPFAIALIEDFISGIQ